MRSRSPESDPNKTVNHGAVIGSWHHFFLQDGPVLDVNGAITPIEIAL